jgi:hypothetical protein
LFLSVTGILLIGCSTAYLDGIPGIPVSPLLIQLLCKIRQICPKISRESVIGSAYNDVYCPGAIA